jgi:DNA-binding response OmpR family regulator
VLPVVPQDYSETQPDAADAEADAPAQPRVLIIDDSEPTARALSALLRRANYETDVALRGADGIERARSVYAGGRSFAAAVVDIHLPDISGLIVSQKLRELLGPQTPIIVLSGDTSMPTLNSLPHVGATYFFSKPVNANQLLERLKGWIGAGPERRDQKMDDGR